MKKYFSLKKINFLVLILLCFITYWQVSMGYKACAGDCFQYIVLMGKNFFSLAYWHTFFIMYRPFTIPLIYSFFGDYTPQHQQWIVYLQTMLAFLAWLTFAYSLASLINTKPLKIIIFAIILLAMFGRSIYIFNTQLLSDSIALSLLLLWYSFIIHLPKIISKKPNITIALFVIFTLIVTATRDTHAFMILFAIPLIGKMTLSKYEKILLMMIILYIGIACQLHAAHRNKTNMLNIITGVVLPDPEKRDFFIKKGMPVDNKLLADSDVMQPWDFFHLHFKPIQRANNKVENMLGPFLNHAKGVYIQYLLSHPDYILKNVYHFHDVMFNQSFTPITGHFILAKLSLMDDLPLNGLVALSLLALITHFMLPSFAQQEKTFLFYAAIFMLAGLTNAIIAFHGDFWELTEMQRHSLIGSIFFKMGCISLLLGGLFETGMFLLKSSTSKQNC